MIEAVAEAVETDFDVEVLGREAMAEEVGKRARLGYGVSKSVIGVLRDGVTVSIEITRDVTVVVVAWNVDRAVGG